MVPGTLSATILWIQFQHFYDFQKDTLNGAIEVHIIMRDNRFANLALPCIIIDIVHGPRPK